MTTSLKRRMTEGGGVSNGRRYRLRRLTCTQSCTYYRNEYDGQYIFSVSGFRDNCWYGELPGS